MNAASNGLSLVDVAGIRSQSPAGAAKSLRSILSDLDASEKQVFAVRGICALLVEERELFRLDIDPDVNLPFESFDRWLRWICPASWGYVRDALRVVRELDGISFTDLVEIKRCNLEQLKKVSSGVRPLPQVVAAAKELSETGFVDKMNREHHQHLDVKRPVVMAEAAVSSKVDEAVEMATLLYGCKSRGEALEVIAQDFLLSHQEEFVKEN